MKALEVLEKRLLQVGLCAHDSEDHLLLQKLNPYLRNAVPIVLATIFGLIPSYRHIFNTLDNVLECTFGGIVFVGMILLYVTIVTFAMQKRRVKEIIEVIRELVDEGTQLTMIFLSIKYISFVCF